MKEMVGVLVEKNGTIHSFELNAFGMWFMRYVNGKKRIYRCHSYEDCGDFIFRIYIRRTLKEYRRICARINKSRR